MYDFNAAVKPISLSELNSKYLDDQARRQNIARGQQEMQEGTIRLSQLGQQQKDQQALRDAYSKGAGDRNITLSELGKTAPHLVPQLKGQYAAEDQAQLKQQQEAQTLTLQQQKAAYDMAHQQASDIASAYGTVKDQASYDAANAWLKQRGNQGASQAPPTYDPQWVKMHTEGVVPFIEQVKLKQKETEDQLNAAKAAEDARHNKASELNTVRGQNITARGQDMTDARERENTNDKKINSVQNRAALADNVEENLKTVEDVMQRRPDLFGKLSGNLSNAALAIGSNDPDKLAYNQAIENLSIANAGMHQMRSKYAIEGSIKNLNFKNGVDGVKGTVASIRKSAEQFKGEAGDATPAPAAVTAPPAGATHAVKDARGNIIGYTSDGKTMTPIPVKK